MCGFFAVIGDFSSNQAAQLALTGNAIQAHRGPDGMGYRIIDLANGKKALLGHQRLSIIDLSSGGGQPMSSHSGDTTIVFNGEIYNYLELARQSDLQLRSASDTEVLLELSEKVGLRQALTMANGMWGLCIAQANNSAIEFARDRAGKKPLYYWFGDGLLIAASELKTVAKLAGRRFQVDTTVLSDYLNHAVQDASEMSWLAGIKSLPAGSTGHIVWGQDGPRLEIQKLWSPEAKAQQKGLEVSAHELAELLDDSVKLRLRADVPVAVTLSGGVDSSIIAAIMSHQLADPSLVHAISVVSPGQQGDESVHIDRACAALGLTSHKVDLALNPEDNFALIDKVTWHNDAPLASFSNIAFFRLMEHARSQGIKVVLSGQGADEMFCGYKKYFFWALRENLSRGDALGFAGNFFGSILSRTAMAQFSIGEALRYLPKSFSRPNNLLPRDIRTEMGRPELGLGANSVAERQIQDLVKYSVPYLTHYEDRASMANGVEIRLPFLDYRIMEFALKLPLEQKVHNGWTKYVLRKAFKNRLPSSILWRRDKQGFSNPQEQWLKGPLRDELTSFFGGNRLMYDLGLIDRSELLEAWRLFLRGDTRTPHRQMFSVWALEVWLKSFQDFIET
jgi:asparagine synthase (glutamine-hydrolysing)